MSVSPLGDLLVNYGLITAEDRSTISRECGRATQSFAKSILSLGIMGENDLPQLIKKAAGTKIVSRDELLSPSPDAAGYLDSNIMSRLEVIPVALENGKLIVAMLDPTDLDAVAQVEFFARIPVVAAAAKFSDLKMGLTKQLGKKFQPREPELARFLHRYKLRSVSAQAGAQSGQKKSIRQNTSHSDTGYANINEREKTSSSSREVSHVTLQDQPKQSFNNETIVGATTHLDQASLPQSKINYDQPTTVSEPFKTPDTLHSGHIDIGTMASASASASEESQLTIDERQSLMGSMDTTADLASEIPVLQSELSDEELEASNSLSEENATDLNLIVDDSINHEIAEDIVTEASNNPLELEENQFSESQKKQQQNIQSLENSSIVNEGIDNTDLSPVADSHMVSEMESVSDLESQLLTDEQSNRMLESSQSRKDIAEVSVGASEENNVSNHSVEPEFGSSTPNLDERNSSDLNENRVLSEENTQPTIESYASVSTESNVVESGNHTTDLTHLNQFTSDAFNQRLTDDIQIDRLDDFHKPGAVNSNFGEVKLRSEANEIEDIMLDEKDIPGNSKRKIRSRQLIVDDPGFDVDELGVSLHLKQGTDTPKIIDNTLDTLKNAATSYQEKNASEATETKSPLQSPNITGSNSLGAKRSTVSLQSLDTSTRRIAPDKAMGAINHASASLFTVDSFHEACQLIASAMLSAGASEGYFVLFAGNSAGFAWSKGNKREVNADEIRLAENVKHTAWIFDGRVHSIMIEQQNMKIAVLASWDTEVPPQIQQASIRLFKNLFALSFAPSF